MNDLSLTTKYKIVPDVLELDFKHLLLEGYFEDYWHDLQNLTFYVEDFCIYGASYLETGNPYDYFDDDSRESDNRVLIQSDFNRLMEDVHRALRDLNLFHAWMDVGQNGKYEFISCMNMPFVEVW